MIRRIIASLLLLLAGTVATAQVPFPQTLPANTVYGRLGISAGPGQAIPFSVLTSNLTGSGSGIFGLKLSGDTNYTMVLTDRTVLINASLTAPRTVTLFAAATLATGQQICIEDSFGGVNSTKTLTVARAGSDTINGATSYVVNNAFGGVCLISDGSTKWTISTAQTAALAALPATAACTNAAGDGAIIQTAVNTGRPVHIIGPCVLDAPITVSTKGQHIFGDGRITTVLTQSTILTGGSFICSTGEPGPQFSDFQIAFVQPDTAVRANLTAYNPAFKCEGTPRARYERLRVSNAMVAFDILGNSGGTQFHDIEVGAYTASVLIDGSIDSVRIDKMHAWVFGANNSLMTANQQSIYAQVGNNDCATATGTYGITVGRMDDLEITNSLFLMGGPQLCAFQGTGGPGGVSWMPGPALVSVTGSDFDGNNGVVWQQTETSGGANLRVTSTSFTMAAAANQAIQLNGGRITCASCYFEKGVGSATGHVIALTSGKLTISGSHFNINGDVISVNNTGGDLTLTGNTFTKTSATYTRATVACTTGFNSCVVQGNNAQGSVVAATFFTSNADSAQSRIWGNALNSGWTNTFPTGQLGLYEWQGDTSYTPVVACGTGTITTLGTVTGNYQKIGKLVWVSVTIPITTIGTCATTMSVTAPFTANRTAVLGGREQASTGKSLAWNILTGTNSGNVVYYDNTFPGASGVNLNLSGVFEMQ